MDDSQLMRMALGLARKGLGSTSPNPAVGAIVVKGGRIVAKGYHRRAGGPHAEAAAIASAPAGSLKGATLYVTLEPCCHQGRTGPCTEIVIGSGIRKVVAGTLDPNPKVAGKGVRALEAAGIEVTTGVLESECRTLNEAYNKYITTGRPFVTLKLAATLDGRIATRSGESRWITGEKARTYVHRLRAEADAVVTGAETVIKDDPALDVRHVKGADPVRVVLDSTLRIPSGAKVFRGSGPGGTGRLIIFTTRKAGREKVAEARAAGAEVVLVPSSPDGVDIARVLEELGRREVVSVLVEGGSRVAASFLRARAVDKALWFVAPMIIGGDGLAALSTIGTVRLADAVRLSGRKVRSFGEDILIEGYPG